MYYFNYLYFFFDFNINLYFKQLLKLISEKFKFKVMLIII